MLINVAITWTICATKFKINAYMKQFDQLRQLSLLLFSTTMSCIVPHIMKPTYKDGLGTGFQSCPTKNDGFELTKMLPLLEGRYNINWYSKYRVIQFHAFT